jgi:hypothetical protein
MKECLIDGLKKVEIKNLKKSVDFVFQITLLASYILK